MVTYKVVQSVAVNHNISVIATDLAGNTATQLVTISVVTGVTLTITDDVTTAADIAGGDVTFTIIFSEDVNDFDTTDITVTGGTKGALTGTGRTYTLVVALNAVSGIITVSVAADMATGETTGTTNAGITVTQAYDTTAPAAPVIDAPIAGDNIINIAERDAGVVVSGINEVDVSIALCADATPATDPTCAGGTTYDTTVTDTTWSYTLTADDIRAFGDRDVTLTAIATNTAGNTAVSAGISITVDITVPTDLAIDAPVAGDNIINIAERDAGVPITGTHDTALTITLCAGATDATDPTCAGGTTYATVVPTTTTWSYALTAGDITALGEGVVTLTAIATEAGGNTAVSPGHDITVDTTPPTAILEMTDVSQSVGSTSVVLLGRTNHFLPTGEVVNIYAGDDIAYMEGRAELLGQAEVEKDRRSWSFTDTTSAAGDTVMYTAVVADAAGNESELEGRYSSDPLTIAGLRLSVTTMTVTEGSTIPYTVVLTTQPMAPVTVSINQDGEVTTDPVALIFSANNWETPQPVMLTAVKDDDTTTDVTTLIHTASNDTALDSYNTFTADLVITVDDNTLTTITTRLNEQILTRASQAMTASTLESVARRVEAVAGSAGGTGATPALAYQFGGQSSLSGLLKSHGKAMLEDNMEYEQLFDGASFVVPLSATEGGTGGGKYGAGALSLWGSSDFINLGSDNDGLDWDGQVVSINIGVDKLIGEMLAGFALSSNQSSFDYVDANNDNAEGEYNYSNTILHPYIGWFPGEDLELWASVGYGSGEIEIDREGDELSTDTTQQSLSGGFSKRLLNSTRTSGNTTSLNLKGDVSMTSVDVDANTGFVAEKVSSSRLRVLVSGEQQRGLASGGGLTPSLEAGVRHDGGDGVTGTGVELGGGLRYANSGGNVTVSGNVRTLLAHDYDELGVDLLLQLVPSAGRGLSLSLHPVWGKTQSAADKLWNDGASEITGEAGSDTSLQSSLDAEVGYGMAVSIFGAPGILTPYTGMIATDGDTSRLRLGSRFSGGNGLSLNLEGARKNTADGASHIVLLRGEVSF